MAPPTFNDLSKDASDLYNKDFTFGTVKAELKTKSAGLGTELRTSGSHDIETARASGELEAKHTFKDCGITVTKKWRSTNVFTAEVAIEDKLAKGLKNAFETTLEPNTGKRSAKVKTSFKRPNVNAGADLEFKSNFPAVLASVVLGFRQSFFLGASLGYDTEGRKLTKLSYGASYQANGLSLYAGVDNFSNVAASAYQKLADNFEASARLNYATAGHAADFGAAMKYRLADGSSWAKLRVDNRSVLSTAYSFLVRDGFRLTACGNLDLKNLNGGGHQLGLAFNFEP